MRLNLPHFVGCLVFGALVALGHGCRSAATPPSPPTVSEPVSLAVSGADNRGVSVAASGERAVITWTGTVGPVTNVYAAVSRDGGVTFGAPLRVNAVDGDARVSGEQAPRVAITGQDVVVAWQSRADAQAVMRLARSTDAGESFQPAHTIHQVGLAGTRGWASLAVDATGAAHVVWLDARAEVPAASVKAAPMPAGHVHGAGMSTRQNIFHAAVDARGAVAESKIAADVCFCCKTSVATGSNGVVYAAWRHIYPPNLRDMAVAASTDGGRTFGAPVRVSEDGWAIDGCPEDGPSMAVDAAGIVHIVWPTMAPNSKERKAIFYSFSTDGGRTFAPRVQVDAGADTRRPAHPHLAVVGSSLAVTWDEGEGDIRHVKLRPIQSSASSSWSPRFGPPVTVSTGEIVTYPAIAPTTGGAVLAWTSGPSATSAVHVSRVTW